MDNTTYARRIPMLTYCALTKEEHDAYMLTATRNYTEPPIPFHFTTRQPDDQHVGGRVNPKPST